MTSESKSKERKINEIHKFVVLNHILSSNIANIALDISTKGIHKTSPENLKLIKKSIAVLNDCNKKLGGTVVTLDIPKMPSIDSENDQQASGDDLLLQEQLGFINKISNDIARVTDNI